MAHGWSSSARPSPASTPSTTIISRRKPVPREGSPWAGFGAVYGKELADHLSSARMRVLELLVVVTGVAAVFAAILDFKALTATDRFLFLHLMIHSRESLPSFIALVGFLIPLVAIALGFDSVNSEFNRRTLSRV